MLRAWEAGGPPCYHFGSSHLAIANPEVPMAAPKPNPDRSLDPDDFWALPPDGSANVMDEERHQRLLKMPGVVVHRRDPNASLPPPTPIHTVGHITVEELRRLLGREPY